MQFQARYGFAPAAVYGGNLSNSGETVALRDASATTIDTVTYGEADPWPVSADGTGPSLELIDATLANNDSLNWAAATNTTGRTPGAANSVRRSGLGPRVSGLTATPANPAAGEAVTVTATITDQTSAVLRYRTDFAAEQTVPMTDTGGDTWSATIPGAAAGHLIRYRVEATNAIATTRSPRIDDTVIYRGVVVPSGITSPIPQWEWFIAPADYTQMVNNPTQEIVRYGAIAYDGRVYDNIEMEIKGHASQKDPKVSWKFKTPPGYDFDMPGLLVEPVDELDMQADWSDRSHGRAILSWDAYERAGFEDHTMFPVRTQRNAAFQGIYNLQETYDGTWREREGYDDNQFFEAETSAFSTRPVNGAVLQEGARRHRLRRDRGLRQRRPAHRDGPAQLPPRQRRHPADDQLRRGRPPSSSTTTPRPRTSTSPSSRPPAGGACSRGTSTTRSATAAATSTAPS